MKYLNLHMNSTHKHNYVPRNVLLKVQKGDLVYLGVSWGKFQVDDSGNHKGKLHKKLLQLTNFVHADGPKGQGGTIWRQDGQQALLPMLSVTGSRQLVAKGGLPAAPRKSPFNDLTALYK